MASNFQIVFCLSEKQKREILDKYSVKIKVSWIDETFREKYYHFCLHCGRIYSKTGIYYHRENVSLTEAEINRFVAGFSSTCKDIKTSSSGI